MTPERLAQLRRDALDIWDFRGTGMQELLDELDAVTKEREKLKDAAERAVMWLDRFAAEPEDTTVMHELQEALGKSVEHDPMRCRCDA